MSFRTVALLAAFVGGAQAQAPKAPAKPPAKMEVPALVTPIEESTQAAPVSDGDGQEKQKGRRR